MSVQFDPNNNSSYQLPVIGTGVGFNELPDEIIQKIFSYLSDSALGNCCQVSKTWNAIAGEESFRDSLYSEPAIAFGKEKWKKHFGAVGRISRLPENIDEILESPCPIHEGQKIKDTHILVYIPKQINGQPHTANHIG